VSSSGNQLEADIGALLERGDHAGAAAVAIRGYGPQILGFLAAVLKDDSSADEAFSMFSEDLWRGLSRFQRASSFRTWAYKIAWHASRRLLRDPHRRRGRRLGTEEAEALAAEVRSTTVGHLRAEMSHAFRAIYAELEPEDHSLLILRIDRDLSFAEIAGVLATDKKKLSEATLRKRFERLKAQIKRRAIEQKLIPGP
jgi:RNA polymerase sigma-70 factor (ECF subfamily)